MPHATLGRAWPEAEDVQAAQRAAGGHDGGN